MFSVVGSRDRWLPHQPLARTRMSTNPRSHQRERGARKAGTPRQMLPSLPSSVQEIETLFANLCPRFLLGG